MFVVRFSGNTFCCSTIQTHPLENSRIDQRASNRYLSCRSMKQLTAIRVGKMMAHGNWQCGSVIARGLSGGWFVG